MDTDALASVLRTWLSESTPSWEEGVTAGELALDPLRLTPPFCPVSFFTSLLCCFLLCLLGSLFSPLFCSWSSTLSSKHSTPISNLLSLTLPSSLSEALFISLALLFAACPFTCSAVSLAASISPSPVPSLNLSLPFGFSLSASFGLVFSLCPSRSLYVCLSAGRFVQSSSDELLSLLLARLANWLSLDRSSSSRGSPGPWLQSDGWDPGAREWGCGGTGGGDKFGSTVSKSSGSGVMASDLSGVAVAVGVVSGADSS